MCYTATEISHSDKSDVSFGILHFEKKNFPFLPYICPSVSKSLSGLCYSSEFYYFSGNMLIREYSSEFDESSDTGSFPRNQVGIQNS